MKYLKKFSPFKKKEIKSWLDSLDIKNYVINDDLTIDINGDINLRRKLHTKKIPYKFRNVSGEFNCEHNNLKLLTNCPDFVGGDFVCCNNELVSLSEGPKEVLGNYYAYKNQLVTLKGIPKSLYSFYCSDNSITSLEYLENIQHELDIQDNNIKSIEFLPYVNYICILKNPIFELIEPINQWSETSVFKFLNYCKEYDVIIENKNFKYTIILDNLKEVLYMMDLENKYDFDKLKKSKHYLIK